jgi:hypothetical protein
MALDRVFLSVKIGDNGQYLDGMPIDIHDELNQKEPIERTLSPWVKRCYRFIQIDRRMLPKIQELLPPVGYSKVLGPDGRPLKDPEKFRVRGGILPFADLATFTGKTVTELRDQNTSKDIINGLLMPETIFKSSQTFSPEGKILDKGSISAGSYTLGTAKDYTTIALFFADIAATLTGALTGTIQTALTETAITSLAIALAGYGFTLTSDTEHYGDFTAGNLISLNQGHDVVDGNLILINCTSASPGATLNLSKLNIKLTGAMRGWGNTLVDVSDTANITRNWNDILINANTKQYSNFVIVYSSPFRGFNLVGVNSANAGLFIIMVSSTDAIIENCTFWNNLSGIQNYDYAAYAITNIASLGNTASYLEYTYNKIADYNHHACASSDGIGDVGLINLVTADEFESLDITQSNFLKAVVGGTLDSNGVAPSIAANTYGIRGSLRPH